MSDFEKWWDEHGTYLIGQITFVVAQKAYLAGQSSAEQRVKDLEEQLAVRSISALNMETAELRAKCAELEREREILWQAVKLYANDRFLGESVALNALEQIKNPSTPSAEQAMKDAVLCGTGILKDGKRIDPADMYPAAEPSCNPHPDAPHGFCRDESHSENRYVCECEFWEAPAAERPDHRKVMEQALEALELAHPRFGTGTVKYNEAVTALRTTLKGEA